MLSARTRWRVKAIDEQDVDQWQQKLGVSRMVTKLFLARGWTDSERVKEMLHAAEQEFHNPYLLAGMEAAVKRIRLAIERKEKIRIYGDYDCDGISSTTLLFFVLHELGAHFDFYIPNRFSEGYGLNRRAVELAIEDDVQLIVTVDTGISAKEEIAYGQQLGLDFIVTDHHEPPPDLPECVAVINPKLPACSYPYPYLAGVGVVFKLGTALLERIPYEWLDLVTIGTVADLVPLTGENRLFVYHGLNVLNRTKHVGLEALIAISGLEDVQINEEHVGFALGPRLNASGRLDSADIAVKLLTTTSREEADQYAQEIDRLNTVRQKMVEKMTKEAVEWVEHTYPTVKPNVLVVAQEGWNIGVIGIVAAKLVERYYLPTIVLSIDAESGMAKGSARSIDGFDMYRALRECEQWLPHFGGHPMAAGLSIHMDHLELFKTKLDQIGEQWLTEDDLIPVSNVDLVCQIEDVTLEAIEELEQLAPYGVDNPKPQIQIENVRIKEMRQVGANKNHLKCQLDQNGSSLDGIGFQLGDVVPKISPGASLSLIGQVEINEWNGKRKPQIVIKDLCVKEKQYFDWRSVSSLQKRMEHVYFEEGIGLLCFRQLPEIPLAFKECVKLFSFRQVENIDRFDQETWEMDRVDTYILYDFPRSVEQLIQALKLIRNGKRYYLMFMHEHSHFLSTVPTREHFKWFYAFLRQQGSFHLDKHGDKLALRKGWTLDTVKFISAVFLELEFATMENGMIQLKQNPQKKELEQSQLYLQKQTEIQLEQALIYSTYSELVQYLERLTNEGHKEEVLSYGF